MHLTYRGGNMKKIIAITTTLLIGAGLLLAPPASAGIKEDKAFYAFVTKQAPAFKGITRPKLVKTAKTTCEFMRSGFTILETVEVMEDAGFTENQSITFVAATVVFYCPEQEDNY
jgi:hypothetical protein